MNYQEFRCEFLERMKEVMEEGVNITPEQINKNNGIVMEGLVLRKENARVASVFYLEDYFKYWERGVPMEQLVRKVLWQFEHCKPKFDVAAEFFKNYEEAKENICFKLINYERNRELLKKVPHKRILDLAMVFYYRIRNRSNDPGGKCSSGFVGYHTGRTRRKCKALHVSETASGIYQYERISWAGTGKRKADVYSDQ